MVKTTGDAASSALIPSPTAVTHRKIPVAIPAAHVRPARRPDTAVLRVSTKKSGPGDTAPRSTTPAIESSAAKGIIGPR